MLWIIGSVIVVSLLLNLVVGHFKKLHPTDVVEFCVVSLFVGPLATLWLLVFMQPRESQPKENENDPPSQDEVFTILNSKLGGILGYNKS
jgi:hypothetical protein